MVGQSLPPRSQPQRKAVILLFRRRLDGEVLCRALTADGATVEKFGPFGMQMAARLKLGESVQAGDRIIFTYENADAPDDDWAVHLQDVFWKCGPVTRDANLTVLVGSGKDATALVVNVSADMHSDRERGCRYDHRHASRRGW